MANRLPAAATRVGRALWWFGVPLFITGWFAVSHRTIYDRPGALYDAAAVVAPLFPLAAEILLEYTFALVALSIAVAIALWSHRRGTRTVRAETFLIPTAIAGLEAGVRMVWFAACRGVIPSRAALHWELHLAATASLVMMAAPLLVAALLARWRPAGISGTMPRSYSLSAIASITSVLAIWLAFDKLLFRF